ncbi:hypothetical protein ACJMK2_008012 [Sinanodonta woodiana]|uniref:Sulfatase-modifying factor enzyme-like domain-containing protein n=1 Tax=Sinanodonta woodiana TaxID=1069815 RepID=A0ABD3VK91_SINWO
MDSFAWTKLYCLIWFVFIFSCKKVYLQDIRDVINSYDHFDIMKLMKGGKFMIGINDPKSDTGEYPVRMTEVKPFYMDIYPVTVSQMWKFKQRKKRFKTTAEKKGFSWVLSRFVPDDIKLNWASESPERGWLAVKGAMWSRPEGPGSSIRNRLDYPVVHISYYDAKSFCQAVGKRLPTEDEWEFAARGGLEGLQYPWGDKFKKMRMNTWQGKFPDEDQGNDQWVGLSPVYAYGPQNNFSMYNMLGNVWEWTSTNYYDRVVDRSLQELRYVLKGGSYLDTRDGSYNYVVRTSNRMGQAPDYTAHNVGVRCAASAPHLVKRPKQPQKQEEPKTFSTPRPPRLHKLSEMAFPPTGTKGEKQDSKWKSGRRWHGEEL